MLSPRHRIDPVQNLGINSLARDEDLERRRIGRNVEANRLRRRHARLIRISLNEWHSKRRVRDAGRVLLPTPG